MENPVFGTSPEAPNFDTNESSMIAVGCWEAAFDSLNAVGHVQTIILAYLSRKTSDRERKRILEGI